MKEQTGSRSLLISLLLLSLLGTGCRYLRVQRGGAVPGSETGSDTSGSGPRSLTLQESITGFSSWGGISESKRNRHLSDPSGLLLGSVLLQGESYEGAVAINPSEIKGIQ